MAFALVVCDQFSWLAEWNKTKMKCWRFFLCAIFCVICVDVPIRPNKNKTWPINNIRRGTWCLHPARKPKSRHVPFSVLVQLKVVKVTIFIAKVGLLRLYISLDCPINDNVICSHKRIVIVKYTKTKLNTLLQNEQILYLSTLNILLNLNDALCYFKTHKKQITWRNKYLSSVIYFIHLQEFRLFRVFRW